MGEVPRSDGSPCYRHVYYVMGKSSLPYAERCVASLLRSTTESLVVMILTDSPEDAAVVDKAIRPHFDGTRHSLRIVDEVEAGKHAAVYYKDFPAIRQFREGHPCWRKVTDPQMYSEWGQEVIILDPDVYFPNPFAFEEPPEFGIALMWQRPNCLLPEEVVRRAFRQNIALADHTDIGVCQYYAPLHLWVLEDLVKRLSEEPLPRSMHIESIVWAALAAQSGGGLFLPQIYHCYRNTIWRRIARRFGRSGVDSLRRINHQNLTAFHAGGEAKHWLVDAEAAGVLGPLRSAPLRHSPKLRYVPFRPGKFERKFFVRRLAAKTGLSRLWQ